MQRVLVMGSSGSGKSTFALRLAELAGLPFVSLDALFWKPGWQPSEPGPFGERVTAAASQPAWVMDGNYINHGAGELRRELADTVIWFDLSRYQCMTGIMMRIARSYGQVRPEMAAGCPERIDLEFLRYVWNYRREQRPRLVAYFDGLRTDQALIHIVDRRQSDRYLADVNAARSPTIH
jgi:adenylate kinase family enzyme